MDNILTVISRKFFWKSVTTYKLCTTTVTFPGSPLRTKIIEMVFTMCAASEHLLCFLFNYYQIISLFPGTLGKSSKHCRTRKIRHHKKTLLHCGSVQNMFSARHVLDLFISLHSQRLHQLPNGEGPREEVHM